MENNVKFSKNVILVDVSFLDETVSDIKSFLGERLGRTLPDVDLPAWLSYLALDAGLREGDNEIQVLLVHGGEVSALPSIGSTLNMSFRDTVSLTIFT